MGKAEHNTIHVGDWVRFEIIPSWVAELAEESQQVFRFCLGRTYQVVRIDQHGHYELDVSGDVDARFGGFMNCIFLEPKYLALVPLS